MKLMKRIRQIFWPKTTLKDDEKALLEDNFLRSVEGSPDHNEGSFKLTKTLDLTLTKITPAEKAELEMVLLNEHLQLVGLA